MIAITFMVVLSAVLTLLGAIPLYFALKIMGGDVSFGKVLLVKIIGGVLNFVLNLFIGSTGNIISSLIMLPAYRWVFKLGTVKVIIAWVIETVFIVGIILLLGFLGVAAINSFY